jgi:hypothetical protein
LFIDQEDAARGYNRGTAEIARAVADAQAQLDAVIRDGAPTALDFLGEQMQDLAEEVRELAGPLGTVTTAEQAVTSGKAGAWADLLAAAETYDEIRSAQRTLTVAHYPADVWVNTAQRAMFAVGLLANSLDHEAVLVDHRRAQRNRCPDRSVPLELVEYKGWLVAAAKPTYESATARRTWWPSGADKGAYVLWACTVPGVWVPTPDELDAAWAAATAATAAIVDPGGGGMRGGISIDAQLANAATARTNYYTITGARPTETRPTSARPAA